MATFILRNADQNFTLTGWELMYLVSALQALRKGYVLNEHEIPKVDQTISKYESLLGLEPTDSNE